MDYTDYLLAKIELSETPGIDYAFKAAFGGKKASDMSPSERRKEIQR